MAKSATDKFKTQIDKNISWLEGDTKKFEQEIKQGVTSLSTKLDSPISKKFVDELLKYMALLEKYNDQLYTSFNEKYEKISKFENKENLNQQTNNIQTSKQVNVSVNNTKTEDVKKNSRMPKTHTSNSNINMLEQNINNSLKYLSTQIEALTTSNTSNEIKDIKKKINSLKLDLSNEIKQQFDKRKDTDEVIDTLPAKFLDLSKKIDSIESSSYSNKNLEIPKDEQAIVELTKYMKEGLEQFENISRYYITKQSEFESFERKELKTDELLETAKKEGYEEGKKEETIKIAKKILSDFPEKFTDIQSVFGDIISKKYENGEKIEITKENRKESEIIIEGIKSEMTIEILTPAILINNEVVKKATFKESK